MKELYISPEVELKMFDLKDVIATSEGDKDKPGDGVVDNSELQDPLWTNTF